MAAKGYWSKSGCRFSQKACLQGFGAFPISIVQQSGISRQFLQTGLTAAVGIKKSRFQTANRRTFREFLQPTESLLVLVVRRARRMTKPISRACCALYWRQNQILGLFSARQLSEIASLKPPSKLPIIGLSENSIVSSDRQVTKCAERDLNGVALQPKQLQLGHRSESTSQVEHVQAGSATFVYIPSHPLRFFGAPPAQKKAYLSGSGEARHR